MFVAFCCAFGCAFGCMLVVCLLCGIAWSLFVVALALVLLMLGDL